MPFNSLAYVLLLGFAVAGARYLARPAGLLILCSLIFYSVAGVGDFAVFLATVMGNWLIQIAIAPLRARVAVAAVMNIGLIIFFKYQGFFLGGASAATAGSYVDTALPLGISFYSFQALAYHIDVARGTSPPARDFKSFFLFKSFFPQLVAGPIVRAHQLLPQVQRLFAAAPHRHYRLVAYGLALCVLGLVKKIILADSIAPFVDGAFASVPGTSFEAWIGATLFAFQIYFDFSGYSDIAIGSAYVLGLRLPVNFRTPYLSLGPRQFWQRWHISLSTWIRDYLYIPLGGRGGGAWRSATVLLMTMAIAGLWHGANYTFVLWGGAWGGYILLGRLLPARLANSRWLWLPHMTVVVALWVLFRAPSLEFAIAYWQAMAGLRLSVMASVSQPLNALAAYGIAALFGLHLLEARLGRRRILFTLRRLNGAVGIGLLVGIIVLLMLLPTFHANPFIYFRF
ncbi:MAG: MBOAT family O-acyltransferase [Thermodesulfobacteriota bacterium]